MNFLSWPRVKRTHKASVNISNSSSLLYTYIDIGVFKDYSSEIRFHIEWRCKSTFTKFSLLQGSRSKVFSIYFLMFTWNFQPLLNVCTLRA
jgi:hypothetical protein